MSHARVITIGTLVLGGLDPATATRILPELVEACRMFGIDTPARRASFVAQCSVESDDFSRREEDLFYTTAARVLFVFPGHVKTREEAERLTRNPVGLANHVYAGVNGNDPDPAVGDGWRYRGRGWIELSGKENYARIGKVCGRPFLDEPDTVAQVPGAWLSAAAFFKTRGCCELADAGRWDDVTRRVNGRRMLKGAERTRRTMEFLFAFG